MKNALLLSLLFCTLSAAQAQTGVITLIHHNGDPTEFFYQPNANASLSSIVTNNAQAGDTIVLPGGECGPTTPSVTIDKPLTIIGAGIYPTGALVTQKTVISGTLYSGFHVDPMGDGSRFEGIDFDCFVDISSGVSSVTFSRCEFNSISFGTLYQPAPTGVIASQCIFQGGVTAHASTGLGIVVSNSIIVGDLAFGASVFTSAYIDQCIFIGAFVGTVDENTGVTYSNCAFISSSTSDMAINNASMYDHCLFAPTNGQVNIDPQTVHLGTVSTTNPVSLFTHIEDPGGIDAFNYNNNYTPVSGSLLLGTGVDGQNIGLYGPGTTGWKELAIPSNPHWTQFTPNGSLNTTGGTIEVHIAAEAQQN